MNLESSLARIADALERANQLNEIALRSDPNARTLMPPVEGEPVVAAPAEPAPAKTEKKVKPAPVAQEPAVLEVVEDASPNPADHALKNDPSPANPDATIAESDMVSFRQRNTMFIKDRTDRKNAVIALVATFGVTALPKMKASDFPRFLEAYAKLETELA